ncbi:sensor histidine kinase [Bradyrhizobium australiense]|uniref:histidine kinase n=1 Tax=Bradyrhizobium australiense TaxID=2721161 RepID=A0A7Y4GQ98_9BRAD|nr:ATP-binding protein [Bradyrhizobium australiense]NOJ40000.1 ATPase [Bradyrhizobium australiense]
MTYRTILCAVFLFLVAVDTACAEPKRVFLLHSFGRDFAPWNEYARSIREELDRQSPGPIDIFEASLATARFAGDEEGPFVDYLRTLFATRKLDLIIAVGGPAVNFVQRNRQQLFPAIPALFTALEHRRVSLSRLTANDAVVAANNDFPVIIDNILQVLPETTDVVVVLGNSPLEKYWVEQLRLDFKRFEGRVAFTWFNELSLEEMLKRAATLPPRSAIFFGLLSVDAAGVPHEEGKALKRIHEVATAPTFSHSDHFFGQGIVGGPLISISSVGRQAANAAVRILGGEAPETVKTAAIGYASPRFDWRELQRWDISESRLPKGSDVYFRVPSMWEQYQSQVTAGAAALLIQAAIISWLLLERRRRYFAEAEASSRRREVVRLNRVATASVLSSSIAHEINQPLGAILNNTEAAQIMIKANPPDLAQVGEILSDIIRDEQRVAEIILGLRNLLNNTKDQNLQTFDLNDTVSEVLGILGPEAAKRAVTVINERPTDALPVRADPIHIQQVILNLMMNGMDSMDACEPESRKLMVRTFRNLHSKMAEVAIADSGKGIPEENLKTVFNAFFTTKPQGTGLGLPIARTIVQTYGGTIWAENRNRGTVFHFTLPLCAASHGKEKYGESASGLLRS